MNERVGERVASIETTEAIRACLPDLSVPSLEVLGEGDFCAAYLLNETRVVRVPKHEEARSALAREACLMPRIQAALPLPVSQPSYLSSAAGPYSLSVHERLSGTELSKPLWTAFPEPLRRSLAAGVGSFLGALHSLDVSLGESCGVAVVDHRQEIVGLERRLKGRVGGLMPGALRTALRDCFARYLAGGPRWSYRPAILHGDFGPGHVLVDVERGVLSGVIDWGDARIGDPARDFIFVYEDWGSEFLRLALRGYVLEAGPQLLLRVHLHYLADQLEWTLSAGERGRLDDLAHGVDALWQGVRDFERSVA